MSESNPDRITLASALYAKRDIVLGDGKKFAFKGFQTIIVPLIQELAKTLERQNRHVTRNALRDSFRHYFGHTPWSQFLNQWIADAGIKIHERGAKEKKKKPAARKKRTRKPPVKAEIPPV